MLQFDGENYVSADGSIDCVQIIRDDADIEDDETFSVTLSDPYNYFEIEYSDNTRIFKIINGIIYLCVILSV